MLRVKPLVLERSYLQEHVSNTENHSYLVSSSFEIKRIHCTQQYDLSIFVSDSDSFTTHCEAYGDVNFRKIIEMVVESLLVTVED